MRNLVFGSMLLAGTLALLGGAGEEKPAKPVLPPDLARVPVKARYVASVRVADVWNSAVVKGVRDKLGKDVEGMTRGIEKELGLGPAQVERMTLVFTRFEGNPEPILFVATRQAIDRDTFLARLIPGGKAQKHAGQSYFASERRAAVILGDRAFAMGPVAEIQAVLDTGKEGGTGALAAVLAKASGKHAAVVGLDVASLPIPDEKLPPQLAGLVPLLKARVATVTADLGTSARARLRLEFKSPADARAGAKAVETVRKMGSDVLDQGIKGLGRDRSAATVVELLERMKKSLGSAPVAQEGTTLTGNLELELDAKTVGAVVVDAMTRVRQAAMRAQSSNNLKQIALAMHNYQGAHDVFPPQAIHDKDGKALLSWRVLILPYIEQDALYREFKLNEAWDSPHNKKLLAKMPRLYQHPTMKAKQVGGTFYQAFVGKDAGFEGKRGQRITDFSDGTSNTILVAEGAREVPWSKPEDLPYDPAKPVPKVGGLFPNGFLAAFADGSVRFLSASIKEANLRAYITRNGGEVVGADD